MGRSFSSDDVIRQLKRAGWSIDRVKGSHHILVNKERTKHVTVPHPKKHMPIGTLKSIEKQAGITFE